MKAKINYKKCCWKDRKCECSCDCEDSGENKSCVSCVEVCPVRAIQRKEKVIIDEKKCTGCGACVEACSRGALSLS